MKNNKKQFWHKNGRAYLFLLISYVSILLLTLSSSLVYYAKINRQITAQTEISRQLLLTELHTSVESDTSDIESLCNEIAFDRTLYQYAKGFPTSTYKDVKSLLSSKTNYSDVMYDYFVYIKNADEIITPTIRMPSQQFYDIIYNFVDLSYEDFRSQYLEETHFQSYLPIRELTLYDDRTVTIMPFIQTFPVGNSQEPLGQVVCFIDAAKLFGQVNLIHQSTGSDVYILNEQNELIISNPNAAFLDTGIIDSIASGKATRDAVISKQIANSTGWKFIVQTPKSLSFVENKDFLMSFLIIFLFYLIVGLLLVRFFTNKSYHPIQEINSLIQSNQNGEENEYPKNEYQTIKTTIIQQFQQDKRLNGIIESQVPYVQSAILNRMLKGLVKDYDKALERLCELNLDFPGDTFLLLSLEMDKTSPFLQSEHSQEEDLVLARLIASNVGKELFEEQFFSYFMDYEQQKCLFILQKTAAVDDASINDTVVALSTQLLDFLAEKFSLHCYIGISALHTASNLPLCLDEASKASEYGHMIHSLAPVLFKDIQQQENNYYYPAEMEYQIISSLKSGQFEQTQELIDKVFQLNTEDKNLSSHALRGLLFEMNSTLQKQLSSLHIAKGEAPVQEECPDVFSEFPSIDAAREKYFSMIEQICAQKQTMPGISKPEKLAASIAEFIDAHAKNAWIDLNTLSEEFQVTPQYISNIFKKYRGENIKDAISKAKLELAKELLLTTDSSVNEIAQKLGYAGEIGIIRLFKKYEGITPGDYRSAYMSKENK